MSIGTIDLRGRDPYRRRGARLVVLACLAIAAAAWGQDPPASAGVPRDGEFLRVLSDETGSPTALQASIVSYRAGSAASDLQVDLVSAVHIADQSYFAALNERFAEYDAVLYELVAPAGTRVPPGGGGHAGVVSNTQLALTRFLDLTFQLEQIDYTPDNFVHADLSPEEFAQSMTDRGESISQYLVKLVAAAMSEQARDPYGVGNVNLLAALFSADRARLLKAEFARAMADMEAFMLMFEGQDGSTLVTERNKRAVAVLEERIELGDRHIAIFYGAAHMTDLAARLESELGLVRAGVVWLDAWDLR